MFTQPQLRGRHDSTAESQTAAGPTPQPTPAESIQPQGPEECGLERIGLFWAAEPLQGPTDAFRTSGARVAAATWTQALVAHVSVPRIDVFVPITDLDWCRQRLLRTRIESGDDGATLRLHAGSAVAERMREQRPSVLHYPGCDLTALSYIRSRFSRRIFPVTCSHMAASYNESFLQFAVRLLSTRIYSCDAIVCATEASRRALANRLSDTAQRYSRPWDRAIPALPRMEVVPWGIDTQRFSPRDPTAARRALELPPERPIILAVGRLRIEDKMDWTPLLLAFDRVHRATNRRPFFVLAGTSPSNYGDHVTAQAAQIGLRDSLRTFFNVPPACLPILYAACDVFVSPADTLSETFGLTVAEAMACGRPVVASDWNGYKELIVHGETGFKVRTDWADCLGDVNLLAPFLPLQQEHLHSGQSVSVDVGQMANYLVQLLENAELRGEMGQRARARAVALYDWPAVISQWEALWQDLLVSARCIDQADPDRLDYLQPNYFQNFSHYASRIIDDTAAIRITPRGADLLSGAGPLFLHPWAQGFLSTQNLLAVLTAARPAGPITSLSIGTVLRALRQSQGMDRNQALMHLMWLAKYDLVSLGEQGSTSDGAASS